MAVRVSDNNYGVGQEIFQREMKNVGVWLCVIFEETGETGKDKNVPPLDTGFSISFFCLVCTNVEGGDTRCDVFKKVVAHLACLSQGKDPHRARTIRCLLAAER